MRINTITPNTINRRYNSIPFKSEKETDNNSGSALNIGYYRPNQDVTQFNQKIADVNVKKTGSIISNVISRVFNHNHNPDPKMMNDKQLKEYMYQRVYMI